MNLFPFFSSGYRRKIAISVLASFCMLVLLAESSPAQEKKITNKIGMSFILVEIGRAHV